MTVRLLTEKQKTEKVCVFEMFAGIRRYTCGKPAVAKVGKDGYVCQEHMDYTLSVVPTPVEKAS